MAIVVQAKPYESVDQLIKRFQWAVMKDDPRVELKEREFYRKPSLVKKDNQRDLRNKLRQNNRKRNYEV